MDQICFQLAYQNCTNQYFTDELESAYFVNGNFRGNKLYNGSQFGISN